MKILPLKNDDLGRPGRDIIATPQLAKGAITIEESSFFLLKNPDFLIKNPDFLIKNLHFTIQQTRPTESGNE